MLVAQVKLLPHPTRSNEAATGTNSLRINPSFPKPVERRGAPRPLEILRNDGLTPSAWQSFSTVLRSAAAETLATSCLGDAATLTAMRIGDEVERRKHLRTKVAIALEAGDIDGSLRDVDALPAEPYASHWYRAEARVEIASHLAAQGPREKALEVVATGAPILARTDEGRLLNRILDEVTLVDSWWQTRPPPGSGSIATLTV